MPVAFFVSRTALGLAGVGAAAPAASLASLIVGIWFLLSGRWKTNNTGISAAVGLTPPGRATRSACDLTAAGGCPPARDQAGAAYAAANAHGGAIKMDNFITTVNAVLPLFLIMALGYGIRRTPLMDEHTHQKMNKLIFQLFLPILLLKNISTSSLDALSGSWVFVFGFVSEMALFLILFAVVPLIEKENRRRGVLIQALGRSNYALFGLPLVGLLYPARTSPSLRCWSRYRLPVFNVMSVVALETWRGGKLKCSRYCAA